MQGTRPSQATHLVSKSKKVRVWYCRFGHASNDKIIRPSKLLTDMKNFNNIYNSTKVYSNLEQSDLNNNKPADMSKNAEEPAKAGGHSDTKDTDKYLNKDTNPNSTASHQTLPVKTLVLVDTSDDNFDTLCTLYIANQQI